MNIEALTLVAVGAAKSAGTEIMEVYGAPDIGLAYKEDDSPLTRADKAAHHCILEILQETGLPVLSEEGEEVPYAVRSQWDWFWMVDPMDGTKEFVKRNGEFTVNIALIHEGRPVLGVVYAPVMGWMYWGSEAEGAWKQVGDRPPFRLGPVQKEQVGTMVVSLSHPSPQTRAFMADYPEASVISMGSSLKFMLLAEGKAEIYPRFAPCMEWDTAAAHGVLNAMGGQVLQAESDQSLEYNKKDLHNPYFIASTVT